jgi:hypothetical protein
MFIYVACNDDYHMPSHLMHHLHNHLHLCIITGSQEESVATEPEATEEVPQEEPAQEVRPRWTPLTNFKSVQTTVRVHLSKASSRAS